MTSARKVHPLIALDFMMHLFINVMLEGIKHVTNPKFQPFTIIFQQEKDRFSDILHNFAA